MSYRSCCAVAAVIALWAAAPCCEAVVLFQWDDFEDGTTNGWVGGAMPVNIGSGGPTGAGDAYLQITSNGAVGPGSKLGTRNQGPAWTGNYLAAGAQRLAVDFLNPNAFALSMRAVLVDPFSQRWTSTVAADVPADGMWHTYEFSLFESELTRVAGLGTYGDVIQTVDRMLIRHNSGPPSADGTTIAATLGIDNVRLLPGGDFDLDGLVNATDIDALVAAIASGTDPIGFDLDGDGVVGSADLGEWLRLAGHLNLGPGKSYQVGDATLDGVVDGADFVAWNGSKFTATPAWTSGDFNASGNVDGQDFVLWNANKFTSADQVVPEPNMPGWIGFILLMAIRLRMIGLVPHPASSMGP